MSGVTDEQKFCWVIMFEENGKLYPYTNRTIGYMTAKVAESRRDHGAWPYRIWVCVDGEMQKVEINVPQASE